ncbi:hypothetical protein MYX07_03255 [Patescibacteria group bacterium AH-259-L07]|nr:hypothetical protein [Patescibacteria group bacterium AH-259-L07]
MKPKIIRSERLKEKDYGATRVVHILNTDKWPYFSMAKVRKVSDDIRLGYDAESNVVYYVLEGKGTCVMSDKEYRIKKGDCLVLPKGTKYKNLKGLTLLAIASPRFDREKRVYVD